jgi:hypothetical protein
MSACFKLDLPERYTEERLPEEYEKCLVSLTSILERHGTLHNKQRIKEKRYRHFP